MKKDYLGKCEVDNKTYSVLITAESREEAIETYEKYMMSHKGFLIPNNYKKHIAELWFMKYEDIPEEAIKELEQYNCTIL